MSDLQDIIATSTMRAFRSGMRAERQHVIELLQEAKKETHCDCANCDQWLNAFEFLIAKIEGKINA